LLAVAERPDFIALETLAGQVAERIVLVLGACTPGIDQELGHGVDRHDNHAGRGWEGVAFDQA
jgi:hypothetical protein